MVEHSASCIGNLKVESKPHMILTQPLPSFPTTKDKNTYTPNTLKVLDILGAEKVPNLI